MKVVHKFGAHTLDAQVKIVILGTFNPDVPQNPAAFFYGRAQNYLWELLPRSFGVPGLKRGTEEDKLSFMQRYCIDFIDLISEVDVEPGEEANYSDNYIDARITRWNNVEESFTKCEQLKLVCFTRRSFSGIPNIKQRVAEVEQFCEGRRITFSYLITPARIISNQKLDEWRAVLAPRRDE